MEAENGSNKKRKVKKTGTMKLHESKTLDFGSNQSKSNEDRCKTEHENDDKQEYIMEKIVNMEEDGHQLIEIKWHGYPSEEK